MAHLGTRSNAVPATTFRAAIPDLPGLYSWWADDEGLDQLSAELGERLPALIYAGQAGATSAHTRAKRAATLRSRIGGNHLNGNVSSSTFRRTLSALLFDPLRLELAPSGRLDATSNAAVSAWIREHLSVAWVSCPDRETLAQIEQLVLAYLNPPLNLMGRPTTPVRQRVRQLRAGLGRTVQ
ncbi:MAG: hypothetical protein M3O70_29240 [Actinomycetota bacterium]|nr:hypothetical protein [Actinomycetota bacterium]